MGMRIKKFRCINCGGPKVNEYKSPYIMCDFCGSFTDIDFTMGMDTWNESTARTSNYQSRKIEYFTGIQSALMAGDKRNYFALQREYWDFYYRSFPAYLPPSIDDVEKYSIYLDVCAVSSTESGFDSKWQQYAVRQQQLQSEVQYRRNGPDTKAETSSFFALADFFWQITKEAMRTFYEDPRYAIMHELIPETVHLKMKMSMFVQAWLPYLSDNDARRLLAMIGFSNEYVELERPSGATVECASCHVALFAPEGSYRVFCEACRTTMPVRKSFYCMSCGASNEVTGNPGKPIDCSRCGIANRLIHAQFG
jgi:hypothetical protein